MKFLNILIIKFFIITSVYSQKNVNVSGKVIDKKTGESLIGATISFKQNDQVINGTVTDFDGNYLLSVKSGMYNIVTSYISYTDQELKDIVIDDSKENIVDFLMEEGGLALTEITIVADKVTNTEASLVALQRKSFNIQDGLSSQQISKTAVSNAADAMKQVAGAVVENGKFIVMRGLGDRYSISQLNGMTMPSTDPYRNSTSLDLIPSQMIENIITVKTFTPDLPGNFSGGLVNVTTKSFPTKMHVNLGISGSYNTQSSLIDNFLGHGEDSGKTDYLGIDDGGRAIPEILKDEKIRALLSQNAYLNARRNDPAYNDLREILNSTSTQLSNVFIPTKKSTPINHGINLTLGNSSILGKTTIGYSLGVNYSNDFAHYDNGSVNTYTNNGNSLFEYQKLSETKSVQTPHLGGLANLSFKFGSNNAINFNAIYNNDTDIVGRQQSGSFVGQLSTPNGIYQTNSMEFIRRNFTSYQASGKHVFPKLKNIEIQWNGLINRSIQEEPDSRYFAYVQYEEDNETIYAINDAEFRPPFHFFRDLGDKGFEGKLDINIPFLTKGVQGSSNLIKIGGLYSSSERTFSEYQFQHSRHGGIPSTIAFSQYKGDFNSFFDYSNFGVIDTTYDNAGGIKQYQIGYHYINQINNKNFYEGQSNIGAAYAMAIYNITQKLKAVGGLRMEATDLFVESRDSTLAPSNLDLVDFLYSGNLIYALNDKSNIRAAVTQTLARPNMRELAPFEQFDTKNGFFNIGNPSLKRTLIHNYDLRYEVYPELGELIAFSVFYKQFKNPILRTFSPTATIPELGYLNIEKADVLGVELEVRKSLNFIMDKMKNFYITANIAFINSEYKIPESELKASQTIDPNYSQTKRPFQGQAPYIVNTILSYTNPDMGWDSALSFNISGRRLYNISLAAVPDVYEDPFPLLTYTISKRLFDNIRITLSAKNLLNPVNSRSQEYKDLVFDNESFKLGRTFGFSINYSIK